MKFYGTFSSKKRVAEFEGYEYVLLSNGKYVLRNIYKTTLSIDKEILLELAKQIIENDKNLVWITPINGI